MSYKKQHTFENLGKLIQKLTPQLYKGCGLCIFYNIYICKDRPNIKKVKKNARTGQLGYSQLHLIKGRLVS